MDNGGKNLSNRIFDLISNKTFGIDCDRMDYMQRDPFYSGITLNYDKDLLR